MLPTYSISNDKLAQELQRLKAANNMKQAEI